MASCVGSEVFVDAVDGGGCGYAGLATDTHLDASALLTCDIVEVTDGLWRSASSEPLL